MKIFDCFMFYDEEMLLDVRLNTLDKFIDKFIVVESKFTHSGKKRDLLFDIKKYQKFKDKINYLVVESLPKDIEAINSYDADRYDNDITYMGIDDTQRLTDFIDIRPRVSTYDPATAL